MKGSTKELSSYSIPTIRMVNAGLRACLVVHSPEGDRYTLDRVIDISVWQSVLTWDKVYPGYW